MKGTRAPEVQREIELEEAYDLGYSHGMAEKIKFTHRNGETEDPTVDGWYFVYWGDQCWIQRNPCSELVGTLRFYGPIPEPSR